MGTFIRFPNGDIHETDHPEYHPEAQRLSRAKGREARAEYCKRQLLEILTSGTDNTVYTVLRHVSASGMSRRIDLYVIRDNRPRFISAYVADVLESKLSEKGGIVTPGCGMDMGFHLVYSLASRLGINLRHEWI